MKPSDLATGHKPEEIAGVAASNGASSMDKSARPDSRAAAAAPFKKNGATKFHLNSKVNILLVDDRQDKLLALEAVLGTLGENLVKARSGKEALRHLLQTEFAVILLDVSMPGMDGFETASLIRKRPATEYTPIIFVTSMGNSPGQMYQGYSLGAVDYILTPIVPDVLRAKVSVFVELWKKTEQIRQQSEQLRHIEEAEHRKKLAEAEDKLEAETKRNRFFTLALDMLGIGNFDGYLLQINPAWERTLGYTEAEMKSVPAFDFVHPEDRAGLPEKVHALKRGECVEYFEIRARHKDGSYRWIGWTAAPFPAEKLIYIFGRDVTPRRQAEDKIQHLNAELEKRVVALTEVNNELESFNYSISHDLRAPLRSMSSFAQALLYQEEGKLSAPALDYAQRIIRSAKYMDTLLQDLLAYSRMVRSETPLARIRLDETVSEILSQFENEIREKNVAVEVRSPLGEVAAHSPTLKQILGNLIGNALKFVSPDRPPRLRIYTEGAPAADGCPVETVRLWVEDEGIGIAPEHHEKIFGLFERLHDSQAFPGTGVGLALVRKGAERMGGKAGLVSEAGKGSRFWVEFPSAKTLQPKS